LNDSDSRVMADLDSSGWSPLKKFTTNEYVIRKTVRAIAAAANGEWVNQHRPLNTPSKPFKAVKNDGKLVIAEETYQRYTPYVNAIVALEAKDASALYKTYSPLLEEAYKELGLKEGDFSSAVNKALTTIENTPEDVELELIHPTVMYKFKNKDVEKLPGIQKLMLRIGPDNRERLKNWLQSLQSELSKPAA